MTTQTDFIFAYFILFVCCSNAFGQQQYPTVNCPHVFNYSYDPKYGGHYGSVRVQRDGSARSEIQVNMSVNVQGHVYSNLQIITLSRTEDFFLKDSLLKYAIRFPLQTAIPKLISLKFNDRLLCSGASDPLIPGIVQTHMWAKSTVTTYGPFLSSQTQQTKPFEIFLPTSPPIQVPTVTSTNQQQHVTSSHQSIVSVSSTPYQCGTTSESGGGSVSSGGVVLPGEYPWLAAIMHKQNSDYRFQCTGTLISDKHVITAGHCTQNSTSTKANVNDDNLFIVLGKLNIEKGIEEGGVVRKARDVVRHPNYQNNNPNADIAIILLNEPIIFKPTILPVCLWSGGNDPSAILGKSGTVVGWQQNRAERIPRKIDLPVVPQEECRLKSNKIFDGWYTSSGTFCAGTRNNLIGTLSQGNGVSFVIKDEPTQRWYLRGLGGYALREPLSLSYDLTHYFIFTDVAKTRLWIEEEMLKEKLPTEI